MREYENVEKAILIETLAEETERLTKLLTEHRLDQEYHNCKQMIDKLTEEIALRSDVHAHPRGLTRI